MSEARNFLNLLFPDIEAGAILVWKKEGKKSTWFDDPDKAADFASGKADVYIGCGLRKEQLPFPRRGGEKEIASIPGLWADLDLFHGVHSAINLPSLEEGLDLVSKMPHQPSFIVNSGGGLHLWWLFKELWILDTQKERLEARRLMDGWQQFLINEASMMGFHVDNTSPLSHVLRIPGTINSKSDPAKLVTFFNTDNLSFDNPIRYNISDFEDHDYLSSIYYCEPKAKGAYQEPESDILYSGCSWLSHCRNDSKLLAEPEWYAMLGILGRCKDGVVKAHAASTDYPKYSRSETDKKIEHALKSGPILCSTVKGKFGPQWCDGCTYGNHIVTPIQIAEVPKNTEIPHVEVKYTKGLTDSKWELARQADSELEDVFNGEKLKSPRDRELSLAYRLIQLAWTPQEITNILIEFHNHHDAELKDQVYYGRIIALSQKLFDKNQASDLLDEYYELGIDGKADDEEKRKILFDTASKTLGVKITNFVKYLSDPPHYELVTECGTVSLGQDCLNQTKFRKAIFESINRVIRQQKATKWESALQSLANAREERDAGPEATDKGALSLWIEEYLTHFKPMEVNDSKFRFTGDPFVKEGLTYICGNPFRYWLFAHCNETLGRRKMGLMFRKQGLIPSRVRVPDSSAKDKLIRCWQVPQSSLVTL